MANIPCWSFILLSSIAYAQDRIDFTVLSKVPTLSGTAIGFAATDKAIFLRDWEDYYHYSFAGNTWNKLKFPKRIQAVEQGIPKFTTSQGLNKLTTLSRTSQIALSYLPSFGKIIGFANQIEILDCGSLAVTYLQVDGGAPMCSGSGVWQERIYLIGGLIATPRPDDKRHRWNVEFSKRLIAFDPADLTFQELAPLPSPRFTNGVFVSGKLYVLGGNDDNQAFDDILRYDPEMDAWESLGHLPNEMGNYAIASAKENIILLGTRGASGFLGLYNTKTNQYKEYATGLKWKNGAACVHDNKLYYFGGIDIDFPRTIARNLYLLNLDTLLSGDR